MTRVQLTLWFLAAALAVLVACVVPEAVRTIPEGQLYFPTGILYAPGEAEDGGFLFVASSNFDRRYTRGRLTGIDLGGLSCAAADAGPCLPAFPAPVAAAIDIPSLGKIDEKGLASLAGEMDGIPIPAGGPFRILVPSRAEGSPLQVVDTTRERMACQGEGATTDCSVGAISLEANRLTPTGLPRAPSPFSVSISRADGEAYVTSLQPADSPVASNTNLQSFVVKLDALAPAPAVTDESFISLLTSVPTNSVVLGQRYAYASGQQGLALRLIDRRTGKLFNALVESNFNQMDTRGLALGPADESTLYLVSRRPDALLVLAIRNPSSDAPLLSMSHAELLPLGASQVRTIAKRSGGHLALVTCVGTQSYDAVGSAMGSLLIWDAAAGRFVAELSGFGFQPYGLAVQPIGQGARLYVGLFGEGRIAVIDLPDLDRPEDIRLVARLGTSHVCVVNPSASGCTETSP